ncbi:response regulator, partial [Enterobacter hormaechei]|uniref:response regulator n=1 Tax=Enterobacter hormaechei TaxID=158836 RepID=UPI0035235A0B
AGFQVRSVSRGADFRQALCEEEASLAILDVMLPDEDGFSLCRWIRSHQRLACMPIIMLTAKGEEDNKIQGLEVGADDYITKPFSPRELVARLKAVLRRTGPGDSEAPIEVGGLLLDPISHRVTID